MQQTLDLPNLDSKTPHQASTPSTSLATKHRPKQLNDLIGQETTKQILINAINSQQIHHCYLLIGPKGTGKTSTARIAAKSLNCFGSDRPTTTPCNSCLSCKSIDTNSNLDVTELDAASHGGVEDARELIASANYSPIKCRYKVTIIDEAHKLSNSAQNALLKTLEEPPAKTIFILCTTEPQSLLETVRSRCLTLNFHQLDKLTTAKAIYNIALKEGIKLPKPIATEIAIEAEGGMRDAIQMLEKAALFANPITENTISQIVLKPTKEQLKQLIIAILKKDKLLLLKIATELQERQVPPQTTLTQLLLLYKQALLEKHSLAKTDCTKAINSLMEASKLLGNNPKKSELWLELTLLQLIA